MILLVVHCDCLCTAAAAAGGLGGAACRCAALAGGRGAKHRGQRQTHRGYRHNECTSAFVAFSYTE